MNVRIRFGIALAALLPALAGGESPDEYQVKAAFLFNFAKFVEWPPQTFKTPADSILICILGPNPFGRSLDEAVEGKTIDGRKLAVRQVAEIEQAGGCQILFIALRPKKRLPRASLAIAGVLTVGESDGFAAEGGVIGFKLEGGRVRLEVNIEAAEQSKLRISSKLLSLAHIVKTQGM